MFSEKDFKQCDQRAKAKFEKLFYQNFEGFRLVEPIDPYTVDFRVFSKGKMLGLKGRHVGNVEIEVKRVWRTFYFPYADIQILPRKKKFWTDKRFHKGKPTMFVMFNENLSNHLIVQSEVMDELFKRDLGRKYASDRSRGDSFLVLKRKDVLFTELGK